jgi:hypothetical protein
MNIHHLVITSQEDHHHYYYLLNVKYIDNKSKEISFMVDKSKHPKDVKRTMMKWIENLLEENINEMP